MASPMNQTDMQFQAFMARLLDSPQTTWCEKQHMEIGMARDLSVEMTKIAERIRDDATKADHYLVLLKYAKVLDFILSSLAARREINPRTLRTIFKLAGLKVCNDYPD